MKFLITILTFGLFVSVHAADLAGEYTAHVPEMASGLLLRPNHTFEYFFTYGAADYTAKGTWREANGGVVLTSNSSEQKPFKLVRSAKGNPDAARVFVQGPNGQGVAHIDVALATTDGTLEGRTTEEGIATFSPTKALKSVSFRVPVYDVEAGPLTVPAGAYDLWFEINGAAITQLQFRDEPLKLVNNSLQMTFWKGEKPLVYRKR